jgi:uncharacterized membrane protein
MKRLWEVDSLRGIAIIMMLISNFVTDLIYFKLYPGSIFWQLFAIVTASLFLLLVGVSLNLSFSRVKNWSNGRLFKKYFYRGLKIFSWGLIITAVTLIFMGSGSILFGVLHLIGVSVILAMPFLRFKRWYLVLAVIFILVGIYLRTLTFDFSWLLWAGFMPQSFQSVDYFPIFPWFGVVLLGLFIGNMIYPNGKRKLKDVNNIFVRILSFLGRNSLKIYLIHQPIFITLLYFLI